MGTPLKSLSTLLSPRLLSPLSPKLLAVPAKQQFRSLTKCVDSKRTPIVKKLEFSQFSSPKQFLEPIRVKVTDYESDRDREPITERDVVIDTPNKRNIFENGIGGNISHTVLGIGSFGKVVRGIHKGKIVAVKVVRNALTLGEQNVLNLNHRNIVQTLDVIQSELGNFSLIIMEYFQNAKQLQSVLDDPDFELETKIIHFAIDICNGLDFIHKNGILHLDLKPQNILVVGNTCKLCDFGNSVLKDETENFIHQGTAVYTAPELLQGKNPTEKCDVYSLGIVLWQLKSRCPPYCDIDNVQTVIYKVVKSNQRPEKIIPEDDYSRLYQACWDIDPNRRPIISTILHELKEMF